MTLERNVLKFCHLFIPRLQYQKEKHKTSYQTTIYEKSTMRNFTLQTVVAATENIRVPPRNFFWIDRLHVQGLDKVL